MRFKFNVDDERRHEILGIKYPSAMMGGTLNFECGLEQLQTLVNERFIDLEENQNESPTTEEFLEFLKVYPQAYAHGYMVSKDREDYRITLEGIGCNEVNENTELILDFTNLCRWADEFTADKKHLYAWWD